jgi:hypothetical protein
MILIRFSKTLRYGSLENFQFVIIRNTRFAINMRIIILSEPNISDSVPMSRTEKIKTIVWKKVAGHDR